MFVVPFTHSSRHSPLFLLPSSSHWPPHNTHNGDTLHLRHTFTCHSYIYLPPTPSLLLTCLLLITFYPLPLVPKHAYLLLQSRVRYFQYISHFSTSSFYFHAHHFHHNLHRSGTSLRPFLAAFLLLEWRYTSYGGVWSVFLVVFSARKRRCRNRRKEM